jgi:DNA polymerase-1
MRSLNVGMPTAYFYDDGIDGAITSELIETLSKVRVIAIDTETTGLNKTRDVPLFWSLSWRSVDGQVHRCTLHAGLLHRFHKLFDDERISWVFANAKFDMHMLANVGIRFAGQVVDIQVMHALLYEEHPHRLKYISDHILGWTWKDFMDTFKVQKDGRLTRTSTVEEVEAGGRFLSVQDALLWAYENDRDLLTEYASNDAYGTLLLFEKLEDLLMKVEVDCGMDAMMREMDPNHRTIISTLADLFFIVEVPFTKVLWKCERNGVVIDVEFLEGLKAPMEERLGELTRQIAHEADKAGALLTNPNSTKQLREYFFDVMKYTPLKRTKGGKGGVRSPSTDEATIAYLSSKYNDPVANLLLAVRDITKTKGTYVEGLLDRLDEDGRIRTKFNQDVARTGRLSSSDPNLQNIKNPEDDIYQIRKAFIVPPGYVMIVSDYKQLEMRLLAALSGEQDMIDIFKKGWDIHIGNASLVFGFPYDDIKRAKKMSEDEWDALKAQDPVQHKYLQDCLHARSAAKTIGFGLNYGMKEWELAKRLGCSVDDARGKMEAYMERYPAVRKFFEDSVDIVRETTCAHTFLGRRRVLPDIHAHDEQMRWRAERQSGNVRIQGTAADVAKMAMILCDEANLEEKYGCRMLLQVHDELVFECPAETADAAMEEIKNLMEHPFLIDLPVELLTDIDKGAHWAEAK